MKPIAVKKGHGYKIGYDFQRFIEDVIFTEYEIAEVYHNGLPWLIITNYQGERISVRL